MEKIMGGFEKTCVASVTAQGKNILSQNMDISGVSQEEADGRLAYLKSTQEAQAKKTLLSGLANISANTNDAKLQKDIQRVVASIK